MRGLIFPSLRIFSFESKTESDKSDLSETKPQEKPETLPDIYAPLKDISRREKLQVELLPGHSDEAKCENIKRLLAAADVKEKESYKANFDSFMQQQKGKVFNQKQDESLEEIIKNSAALKREIMEYALFLKCTNFKGVNLENADLNGFDLQGCNFSGANLAKANLTKTKLIKCTLQECIFLEANLFGANLQESSVINVNFSGANLNFTDLRGLDLASADFQGAEMQATKMQGTKNLNKDKFKDTRYNNVTELFFLFCPPSKDYEKILSEKMKQSLEKKNFTELVAGTKTIGGF